MVKSDVCATNRPAAPSEAATQAEDRGALLALRRSGQQYRFLDLGYRYLSAVQVDAEVTLELLKALVELGLGVPARELLHQRRDLAEAGLDAAELRKALASIPTGRVPWTALQDQFDTNLAALIRHHQHLHDHRQDIEQSLRGVQLFRSTDGRLHLSRRDTGQLRQWLPCLTDHASTEAARPKPQQLRDAILLIGFHLNDFIDHVYADASAGENNQQIPLFLADPAWHRLAAWLYAQDRTAILSDPRVHIFAGPDAPGQYERALLDNDGLNIAPLRLACYMPDNVCKSFDEAAQRVRIHREKRYVDSLGRLKQRAAQRDDAYWADRLKPGARVIGFTSRFTTMLKYSMRDIGAAMETLGYQFRLCMESADHDRISDVVVARQMAEFDPDLVILINHFRYELPERLADVPVLTWVQDPMPNILSKEAGASIGPRDFVCGYYAKRLAEEFGYPASNLMAAPIPVSTTMFHDGPVDQDDRDRYDCDIMYVGHLHANADEHCAAWKSSAPVQLHPLLDRIRDEVTLRHRRGEHIQFPKALTENIASAMNIALQEGNLENIANLFTDRLFDILFRRETLCWIAHWAERTGRVFKLYGRGWTGDPVLCKYAVGPIEHGEPLRRAYRCARIVLETHPKGFMHQRTFEALASGSLVVSRFAPHSFSGMSIEECERLPKESLNPLAAALAFPGLKEVVFGSPQEFDQLCDRFVLDEAHRREVQTQMQGVVHRDLTYTATLTRIISWVRAELSATARPSSRSETKRMRQA